MCGPTQKMMKAERSEEESAGLKQILDALTDEEKADFPDPNMPLRHLRADKGDVIVATRKIKETLAWRKSFQVAKITNCLHDEGDEETILLKKIIFEEGSTGKLYVRGGYDKEGRATIYMRPRHENTKHELNQMRFLVYTLERAIACTQRRTSGCHEKINIMIDFDGYRIRDAPSLSTSRHTLTILQNHYPERLNVAFVCNPPLAFRAFWSIVQPFIDPLTKEKLIFCHGVAGVAKVAERYDLAHVEKCGGGAHGVKCPPFCSKTYFSTPLVYGYGEVHESSSQSL